MGACRQQCSKGEGSNIIFCLSECFVYHKQQKEATKSREPRSIDRLIDRQTDRFEQKTNAFSNLPYLNLKRI